MVLNINPPAPIQPNWGTWSQLATISVPEKPVSVDGKKSGGGQKITGKKKATCPNCGKSFKTAHQNQRFCKAGCRTYYCRKKSKALIEVICQHYQVDYIGAVIMLEKCGTTALAGQVEKIGYVFDGKAWKKPAVQSQPVNAVAAEKPGKKTRASRRRAAAPVYVPGR